MKEKEKTLISYRGVPWATYVGYEETREVFLNNRGSEEDPLILSEIEGFSNLTTCTKLELIDNNIKKIESLEPLVNLKELNLYGNKITNLKGLEPLINLEILLLSYNKLTSLKGIEALPNLKYLWVHGNELTSIKELASLSKLRQVILSQNSIDSIEPLENLQQLEVVVLPKWSHFPFKICNHFNTEYGTYYRSWEPQQILDLLRKNTPLETKELTNYKMHRNIGFLEEKAKEIPTEAARTFLAWAQKEFQVETTEEFSIML